MGATGPVGFSFGRDTNSLYPRAHDPGTTHVNSQHAILLQYTDRLILSNSLLQIIFSKRKSIQSISFKCESLRIFINSPPVSPELNYYYYCSSSLPQTP